MGHNGQRTNRHQKQINEVKILENELKQFTLAVLKAELFNIKSLYKFNSYICVRIKLCYVGKVPCGTTCRTQQIADCTFAFILAGKHC